MSVYKDEEKGTWYAKFRYTDWTGKPRSTTKRGFRTKREAKQFEVDFKRTSNDTPDMTVGELCKLYMSQYRARMKETSAASIQYMTDMYIAKYLDGVMNPTAKAGGFRRRKLCEKKSFVGQSVGQNLRPPSMSPAKKEAATKDGSQKALLHCITFPADESTPGPSAVPARSPHRPTCLSAS